MAEVQRSSSTAGSGSPSGSSMSPQALDALVLELEQVAAGLGVKVSYEQLETESLGGGGLCKIKGEWRCIVSKRANPGERAALIARSLRRFDCSKVFLTPMARALIGQSEGSAAVDVKKGADAAAGVEG